MELLWGRYVEYIQNSMLTHHKDGQNTQPVHGIRPTSMSSEFEKQPLDNCQEAICVFVFVLFFFPKEVAFSLRYGYMMLWLPDISKVSMLMHLAI